MTFMARVIRALLPKGHAWRWDDFGRRLIEGLSVEIGRLRTFLRDIVAESFPRTATDTLPEWYENLGMPYDATVPLSTRQARAEQQYTAFGGQDIVYLNELLHVAYPNVSIERILEFFETDNMVGHAETGRAETQDYPSWISPRPTDGRETVGYYRVTGTVDSAGDIDAIQLLLDRIAPAEMEPVYDVSVA